jgi:hypothetical protein
MNNMSGPGVQTSGSTVAENSRSVWVFMQNSVLRQEENVLPNSWQKPAR